MGCTQLNFFPSNQGSLGPSGWLLLAESRSMASRRKAHGEGPKAASLSLSHPWPRGAASVTGVPSKRARVAPSRISTFLSGSSHPYSFRKRAVDALRSWTASTTDPTPLSGAPALETLADGLTRKSLGVLSLIMKGRVEPASPSPRKPSSHSTRTPSGLFLV